MFIHMQELLKVRQEKDSTSVIMSHVKDVSQLVCYSTSNEFDCRTSILVYANCSI